jgi:hypothetical protein
MRTEIERERSAFVCMGTPYTFLLFDVRSLNPSPMRKDTVIVDKKQLAGYNITVDKGIVLLDELADFLTTLI